MTYVIDRTDIARQIARLGSARVAAAVQAFGLPPSTHAINVAALTDLVIRGNATMEQIQTARVSVSAAPTPITATVAAPVPAPAATPVDLARVESAAAAAARAESLALDTASKVQKMGEALGSATVTVQGLGAAIESLREEVQKATAVSGSSVQTAIRAVVEKAFGPIRAAVEASPLLADAVKGAVSAAPIARLPVAQVFGVEVSDMKGNPLMVDIWDDPEAPAIDPLFIWSEATLRYIVAAVETGSNLWMGGEKGTGKTETARQFAARTGRRFNRVNFHKYTSAESFIGATSLVNGSTQFELGEFTGVFCTVPGSLSLLDEPSNGDPGEMAQLNALLEPTGRVNLGGIDRSRAPGALCFAADNTMGCGDITGRYTGTRQQNAALMDRFGLKVAFTFLPLQQEIDAVAKHTGCKPTLAREVLKVVTLARAKVQTGEVVDAPSIRQVIAWIRAMPYLGVRGAWVNTVAAAQPPESAAAVEALYTAEVNEERILKML